MGRARSGAREIAYQVLTSIEEKDAFMDRALDAALGHYPQMDERERALATELAYGVTRQQGVLDRIISDHSRTPLEEMDCAVLRILRLGAYQILFLDRIPDHAAVSQSVELAKRCCPLGSPAFLNAVLRAICRNKNSRKTMSILGAAEEGQPAWLVELWKRELGDDQARVLLRAIESQPETVLRVNLLKTGQETLLEELEREGYNVTSFSGLPGALRMIRGGDVRRSEAHRSGRILQQDAASQLVTWILDPCPGHRILDCCAAPGVKTTHINEKMEGRGLVVAVDRHPGRLRDLVRLCEHMGAATVLPVCADASVQGGLPLKDVLFDRVLVDVPCSGLGTLRRTPERKWRDVPRFSELASLQLGILEEASRRLTPGGILVYSTCTVVRGENEVVLERFFSKRKDFILENASLGLPEAFQDLVCERGFFRSWLRPSACDYFFAARLRRL